MCLLLGEDNAAARALHRVAAGYGARVTFEPLGSAADLEAALEASFATCAGSGRVDTVIQVIQSPTDESARVSDWSLGDWTSRVTNPLRSMFYVGRRAVEEFLSGGEGGCLVYVVLPRSGERVDPITRSALLAFVRSIAKEYGARGILCNAVFATGSEGSLAEDGARVVWSLVASARYVTGEALDLAAGEA